MNLIKSKKLKKFKSINHAFFNKAGGKSKGIYRSLNCGIGSKDSKFKVIQNLKIVKKKIGCKNNNLVLLHQIHSNKFYFINKIPKNKLIGDGLITRKKNIGIGILTADCAPVLIFDKFKKTIGAAHVGWKGAYKKILVKMIKFFLTKGSKLENIMVVIGPCIEQKNYEVKSDFFKRFVNQDKNNRIYFKKINKKTFFSLKDHIKGQLERFGIYNIETINKDTYNIKNNFFSSRRSFHKDDNDYGRNISIIMII